MVGASRRRSLLRLAVSLALLVGVAVWLDAGEVVAEVQRLAPGWVLLALLLSLPQVVISAWRWRFTASRLGVGLSWRHAINDYYLASFLNQVLPGAVLGDATRAWRHARASGRRAAAWRGVLIERASGQLVLAVVTLAILALSPLWHTAFGRLLTRPGVVIGAVGALGLAVLGAVLWRRLYRSNLNMPLWAKGLGGDVHRALFSRRAWPAQLGGSLLVLASYGAIFVCAARAIGVELPATTLLALLPPVLLAMLIPLSVAGWGFREGAAALVWLGVGLPPAQGVAVSVSYGLLVLLASLPGALCWWQRKRSAAPGSANGGSQGDIEEGVVAAVETPHRRAQRLVEGVDERQRQSGAAGADQQRRHQQMQAVDAAGGDKLRYGLAAALDQHAAAARLLEGVDHRLGSHSPLGVTRQPALADMRADADRRGHALAEQMQGGQRRVLKYTPRDRHPAARIEHHAQRLAPLDVAHVELRVVLVGGAGADQHCVDQGAQPMQVNPALESIDVVGVTAMGGDTPVEALAELGDDPRSTIADQRQQAVEQGRGGAVQGRLGMPVSAAVQRQTRTITVDDKLGNILPGVVARRQQRLPGERQVGVVTARRWGLGGFAHARPLSIKNVSYHGQPPRAAQVQRTRGAVAPVCRFTTLSAIRLPG